MASNMEDFETRKPALAKEYNDALARGQTDLAEEIIKEFNSLVSTSTSTSIVNSQSQYQSKKCELIQKIEDETLPSTRTLTPNPNLVCYFAA